MKPVRQCSGALQGIPMVSDMVRSPARPWSRERADVVAKLMPTALDVAVFMRAATFPHGKLRVIVSIEDRGGDGLWLHSSAVAVRPGKSRRKGPRIVLPTWEELSLVKAFVHEDRAVVQVIPPRAFYVNLTEALHLWERLDRPVVPPGLWEGM